MDSSSPRRLYLNQLPLNSFNFCLKICLFKFIVCLIQDNLISKSFKKFDQCSCLLRCSPMIWCTFWSLVPYLASLAILICFWYTLVTFSFWMPFYNTSVEMNRDEICKRVWSDCSAESTSLMDQSLWILFWIYKIVQWISC